MSKKIVLSFIILMLLFGTSQPVSFAAPASPQKESKQAISSAIDQAKKAEEERKAVVAKSEKPEVYVERGRIFDSRKELDNAIANYDFAIYLNPKLASAYYYRGKDLLEQRKVAAAFDDFNKVLELQANQKTPQFNAFYMRGLCYMEMGQYQDAVNDFSYALTQATDDDTKAKLYQYRGVAYLNMKMLFPANSDFGMLLSFDRKNPNAYYYAGRLALAAKDYETALKNFDHTIALDPKYTFAHFFKGRIMTFALSKPKAGMESFTRAIACEPGYASFYLNRAHSYLRMGQVELAKKDFAKTVELNPNMANQIPTDKQIEEALRPKGNNIVTVDD